MSENTYALMCEVAELAISFGGVVFGGFVRDFLLREEGEDKNLVPNDLDIHFNDRENYNKFKQELTTNGSYKIMRQTRGAAYNTITLVVSLQIRVLIPRTHLVSSRLIYDQMMDVPKQIPGGTFKIDAVISSNEIKNIDFECNGLVMTKDGIQLGPELSQCLSPIGKYKRFQEVKNDIMKKRAICVNLIKERWDKMDIKENWSIFGEIIHKMEKTTDECIICHELNTDYKLTCCHARYHKDCLKKTLKHDITRCAHCRNIFDCENEVKAFIVE